MKIASEGVSQQEGKSLAHQNCSSVSVELVSPTTQVAREGRDRTVPGPALQGARNSAVPASGKFESALTDYGERPIS